MPPESADRLAKLLERLLTDADFRAVFRRDPSAACQEFGLPDIAGELGRGGKAMHTLELRESKSSLAGVLMAAAAEGVGVLELARYVEGHASLSGDAAGAVRQALTQASLAAVPAARVEQAAASVAPPALGAEAIAPQAPAPAPTPAVAPPPAAPTPGEVPSGAPSGSRVSPPESPSDAATPHTVELAAAESRTADEVIPVAAPAALVTAVPLAPVPAADLADTNAGGTLHGSEFGMPDGEGAPGANGRFHAAYDLFARGGSPVCSPVVGTVVEVRASQGTSGQIFGGTVKIQREDGHVWVFRHVDPTGVVEGQQVAAGQPIAAVTPWADGPSHVHIELWKTLEGGYNFDNMEDPLPELQRAYDAPGTDPELAGLVQADAAELLENPRLTLSEDARTDLASGRVDARLLSVLSTLLERHEVGLSVIETGHPQLTTGGSVSNHFYGRAFDINSVDGRPVDPTNVAARDLAQELAALDAAVRPTEMGTPWPIGDDGFFTDADHQDHIHVGFDTAGPQVISPDPSQVESQGRRTGVFAGIEAQAPTGGARRTMQSLRAVEAEPPASSAAEPAPLPAADSTEAYPGDSASPDQIARWMALQAQAAGLPPELPVMASLVESGLQNLDHGDADSVGFFQMRVGIWNQGDYTGYPENPELQLRWFLDRALAVREKRLSEGFDDFGTSPDSWGEWIADVEQPAAQYRGRYQLRLDEARLLVYRAP